MQLLRAYGNQYLGGGEGLAVQEDVLIDGQRIHLSFVPCDGDPENSQLMARTDVAQLPGAPSAEVCGVLLQANAFWSGIQAGALGLRGSDVVMLSVSHRLAALDAEALAALLQDMASDARRWAVFLQAFSLAQKESPSLGLWT